MQSKQLQQCRPTIRGEIKKARAGNYDTSSCLFEFVDNSMDANADRIRVDIRERTGTGNPHKVIISDNSPTGIPREALGAIFSWTYERKRSETDVGEYGTGFKTASVNLAEKLVVVTKHGDKAYQATADWQDMADEDRWDPQVMEITTDYFQDIHPFHNGSTFILEGLRNEMFVSSTTTTKLVTHFFRKVWDDIAYYYRYVLHENPSLRITLKGTPKDGEEICEMDVREHDLFRAHTDPFHNNSLETMMETSIAVYQDSLQFYRVFFQNAKTKKWEGVEFVEKHKNGNSRLKCQEVLSSVMESMRLIDTLTFRSVHLRNDAEHSSTCMALYPTCTLDILRRGRVMGKDLFLRAPRAEALSCFVKHEVWYHSYHINPLLGVQYNKQNHGTLRENNLRYTMEHVQQVHEREFYKTEKTMLAATPLPTVTSSLPTVDDMSLTFLPATMNGQISSLDIPMGTPLEVRQLPLAPIVPPALPSPHDEISKRKNFTPSTKMEILYRQECRDSVLDLVLKDTVLLMEYDHINGKSSLNTTDNCQALSVITHALKTRKPDIFEKLQNNHETRVEFLVDLLNCITRSRYFIEAWTSGEVRVRDLQQQLGVVQEGLFERPCL
jgi:hypothetical protein